MGDIQPCYLKIRRKIEAILLLIRTTIVQSRIDQPVTFFIFICTLWIKYSTIVNYK